MDVVLMRHKLDVGAYHRMAEAGVLGEHDRVELIDGELIDMAPIGQGHAGAVNRLNQMLVLAFAGRAIVANQNPLRLDEQNEPQPDFTVLRHRADFYAAGDYPGSADVLLLIEVSDSSLRFDLAVKLPLYARALIPEVWIVDVRRRIVDVYRSPRGGEYSEMATHQRGDVLCPSLTPEVRLTLDQVFG